MVQLISFILSRVLVSTASVYRVTFDWISSRGASYAARAANMTFASLLLLAAASSLLISLSLSRSSEASVYPRSQNSVPRASSLVSVICMFPKAYATLSSALGSSSECGIVSVFLHIPKVKDHNGWPIYFGNLEVVKIQDSVYLVSTVAGTYLVSTTARVRALALYVRAQARGPPSRLAGDSILRAHFDKDLARSALGTDALLTPVS